MEDSHREILRYLVTFVALIAVFYGGVVLLRNTLGTSKPVMVVISQSMIPNLGVGDFIFIQSIDDFSTVNVGGPQVGDVLVFVKPGSSGEYIVHRAIDGVETSSGWVFQTKGDYNMFADGFQVPEDLISGKVVNRIPVIGYFSLFIKTTKGFGFILVLMGISFFYDNILPEKTETNRGKFNYLSIIPFLVAPLTLLKLYFFPSSHQVLETLSLISWIIGCITLPLSTEDDDLGLMFWLYHLVLLVVPITCDLVWWRTRITPSNWWPIQGSLVPVSWLLMEETEMFNQVFNIIVIWLSPGIILFLGLLYSKRRGVKSIKKISDMLRHISD